MFSKNTIIKIFFLFAISFCNAQELDSLLLKSYDVLSDNVYKEDSLISFLSAKAYLLKAKINRDSLHIAYGFYYSNLKKVGPNLIIKDSLSLKINDSIIYYSKHLLKHKFFPSLSYSNKGDILYSKGNYKEALKNYLLAIKTSNFGDIYLHQLYHRVGIIKIIFSEPEEALILFKKIYKFNLSNKKVNLNDEHHLYTVFSLGDAYLKNKQLDSARYYYDLGYKRSLNIVDENFKYYFVLGKGISEYHSHNYIAAIDSISKSIPYLINYNDSPNIAYAYCFLGKSYSKLGQVDKAVFNLKKVDSIFNVIHDLHPDLRGTYTYLRKYYKKKKDPKNQLKYTNSLLKLDSIYYKNYNYINAEVYSKFEKKILMDEQKAIKYLLKKEKQRSYWGYIILIVSVFIIFLLSYLNFKKKKKILKISTELLNNSAFKINNEPSKEIVKTHFSEELKEELFKKISLFEKNKEYLNSDIKISTLSEKMNTNSRYLSILINNYMHKNFTQYINDLRITYVIDLLKNEKKYQNYTVNALSIECGFKSSESFSRTFKKKTGIYPSQFIAETYPKFMN